MHPRRWPGALLLVLAALALALTATGARASAGDEAPEYQRCVSSCYADLCGPDGVDDGRTGRPEQHSKQLSWALRWSRWTCRDDCAYHCTHQLTNEAEARVARIRQQVHLEVTSPRPTWGDGHATGPHAAAQEQVTLAARLAALPPYKRQMVKYHGKWVFVRILSAQEPLSALFSILNLALQVWGMRRFRSQVPDAFPLKHMYLTHAGLAAVAWAMSALYHVRDRPLTERMDCIASALLALHLIFLTIARFWRLSPRPSSGTEANALLPPSSVTSPPQTVPSPSFLQPLHRFRQLQRVFLMAFALYLVGFVWSRCSRQYSTTVSSLLVAAQLLVVSLYVIRPATFPGRLELPTAGSDFAATVGVEPRPAFTLQPLQIDQPPAHTGDIIPAPATPHVRGHKVSASSTSASPPHACPRLSETHRRQLSLQAPNEIHVESQSELSAPVSPLILAAPAEPQPSLAPVLTSALVPGTWQQRRRSLVLVVLGMLGAAWLARLDVPPIGRALDAHALWVAALAPITVSWYGWMVADARALTLDAAAGCLPATAVAVPPDPDAYRSCDHRLRGSLATSGGNEAPWVAMDAWPCFAGHGHGTRQALAVVPTPWWASHASLLSAATPRRAAQAVRCTCAYVRSAWQHVWDAALPLRRRGVAGTLFALPDGLAGLLEKSVDHACYIAAGAGASRKSKT